MDGIGPFASEVLSFLLHARRETKIWFHTRFLVPQVDTGDALDVCAWADISRSVE